MNTACQMCGKDCEINQEVKTGMTELKLWCYCKECDTETFHEIGTEKPTEKRNIMTELNYPIEVLEAALNDKLRGIPTIERNIELEGNPLGSWNVFLIQTKGKIEEIETAIKILKENKG